MSIFNIDKNLNVSQLEYPKRGPEEVSSWYRVKYIKE